MTLKKYCLDFFRVVFIRLPKSLFFNLLNRADRILRYFDYVRDFYFFYRQEENSRFQVRFEQRIPCLDDKTNLTNFDRHYIYHPAWAIRILLKINPSRHVDISSTLHFSALASAYLPVSFYDFRPANLILSNLEIGSQDLNNLSFSDDSIECLSCMHVVEHVGLGRYGDKIDSNADLKAIKELSRVVKRNGDLLFVVPVSNVSFIQFNAHRIYRPEMIIDEFRKQGMVLQEFVLIPEDEIDGGLVSFPSMSLMAKQKYGCGCFWFKKAS